MNRIALLGLLTLSLLALNNNYAAEILPRNYDPGAIASAIDQAAPGDTVRLAAGTYQITVPIRLKSGIKVIGAGQDQTRILYRGTQPHTLVSIAGCQDVEMASLTLDGEDNPLVTQGIAGGDSRRVWLHHLTICNLVKSDTFGPHGILFSGNNPTMERGVTDSVISHCRIEKIGLGARFGGGIRLNWGCVRNRIESNIIRHTGRGGIFGDHSAELIIRGNQVSGSGGEGLGIEIWGGCPRSVIEDNLIDHWLSVDAGDQSAVRRNIISADDGSLKGYGIEIIARDVVVTDNIVKRGALIGLSVSNKREKNNVYWAYNTVTDSVQWGAQLQGESGGIARHYFYRCVFENTLQGDPRALYPKDSGHGFRLNGDCRELVLDECWIRNNGGLGVQFSGNNLDLLSFDRCSITGNAGRAMNQPSAYSKLEFFECRLEGNQRNQLPPAKKFANFPPQPDFTVPDLIRARTPAPFLCTSTPETNIVERLWDFGDGIPQTIPDPTHTFERPGKYRVTLVVWDKHGRGARAEKIVQVQFPQP